MKIFKRKKKNPTETMFIRELPDKRTRLEAWTENDGFRVVETTLTITEILNSISAVEHINKVEAEQGKWVGPGHDPSGNQY